MTALTPQDLLNLLKDVQGRSEERDITKYCYVIYARKSTESEERQIRSLGDQVIKCERLAEGKELTLLKRPLSPIEEKKVSKNQMFVVMICIL